MFTYREFVDGTHEYRQRVLREKKSSDSAYVRERTDFESALLSFLGRATSSEQLAKIYLSSFPKFFKYLKNVGTHTILSPDECLAVESLLTNMIEIERRCDAVVGPLEKYYVVERTPLVTPSTEGNQGIILLLVNKTKDTQLPIVRIKIPIKDLESTIHEMYVNWVLNIMRPYIPSFPFLFANWRCGNPFLGFGFDDSIRVCDTSGPRPVFLYENIEGITLFDFLQINFDNLRVETLLDFFAQIFGALDFVNTSNFNFSHNDLHSKNILIQRFDYPTEINFGRYTLTTKFRVVLIDFSLSFIQDRSAKFPVDSSYKLSAKQREILTKISKTKIKYFGATYNRLLGVQSDRVYPLGDVFRLFFDVYSLVNENIKQILTPFVEHFFEGADIGRSGSLLTAGAAVGSSAHLNSFVLPPFDESFFNYQYSDFLNVLFLNFAHKLNFRMMTEPPEIQKIKDPFKPVKKIRLSYLDFVLLSMLDPNIITPKILKDNEKTIEETKNNEISWVKNQIKELKNITLYDFNRQYNAFRDDDNDGAVEFNEKFVANFILRSDLLVQAITGVRMLYSRLKFLWFGGYCETEVPPQSSLSDLCNFLHAGSPLINDDTFEREMNTIERIEEELKKIKKRKTTVREGGNIVNWFIVCLPAVKNYLNFAHSWSSEDAHFGELAMREETVVHRQEKR